MSLLTKNFSRKEFACKCGCGLDTVDYDLVMVLQEVRDYFGKPVTINSGFRCKDQNKRVGGVPNSQHLYGRAADFSVQDTSPKEVHSFLEQSYPHSLGLGLAKTFVHVDTRSGDKARWTY